MKSKYTLLAGLLAGLALLLLVGYFVLFAPANFKGEETRFDVTKGKTIGQIGTDLKEEGLVRSSLGTQLALKISGIRTIKAGSYSLSPRMDTWEIVRILGKSETTNSNVTIPEGYTNEQIAQTLSAKKVITSTAEFISLTKSAAHPGILSSIPASASLEGYLFPDTYNFYPDTEASSVIDQMTANFATRFAKLTDELSASGKSLHEVVTLASLVEKEARSDEDRKLIAGVMENRIEKGMRLDVDATIRYITGDWKNPITQTQLNSDSPYNTRKHTGLPPGPICNPGLAAIEAVLSPTASDYLYYLTDKEGVTHYAKTLDEHNANKVKYLQ